MDGETVELSTLIALGGLVLTLIALTGGVLYRLGQLTSRVNQLAVEAARDREEGRQDRQEMRDEFRQGMREIRDEFRQGMQEMRDENRRNHQQLLQALAHHTHDLDTGFAVFRFPPGTESPEHP